jgi:hypothetical protein
VTFGNGDGLDGAVSTIEAGRVVELGSVNTRQIAEKSAQPQDKTADTAVRPVDPLFIAVAPARSVRSKPPRITTQAQPAQPGTTERH